MGEEWNMRMDLGSQAVTIAHLPRRRARAHLFTLSGRGVVAAAIAAGLLIVGLSFAAARPALQSGRQTPYAWIR
jgi:hypothetical protein